MPSMGALTDPWTGPRTHLLKNGNGKGSGNLLPEPLPKRTLAVKEHCCGETKRGMGA